MIFDGCLRFSCVHYEVVDKKGSVVDRYINEQFISELEYIANWADSTSSKFNMQKIENHCQAEKEQKKNNKNDIVAHMGEPQRVFLNTHNTV